MSMPLLAKLAAITPLLIAASLAAQTHPRVLTRTEIAVAIQKSLDANNLSAGQSLSPDDITIASRVAVTKSDPALVVRQIESRPGSATTHVALWTTSEPRIPPFWVAVDRKIESRAATNNATDAAAPNNVEPSQVRYISRAALRLRPLAHAATATQPPLIHAGNPIQLIVQGAGMRITSKAKALETGRAGQQIRVQTEPTGKILVAKIKNAQTAEIDY